MVSVINLFVVSIILLAIELIVLRVDFTSPAFIFTASFVICFLCTLNLGERWNIEQIHSETYWILITSIVLFVFVEQAVRVIVKKEIALRNIHENNKHPIFISIGFIRFSIVFSIFSIIWSLAIVRDYLNPKDWFSSMEIYKIAINDGSIRNNFSRIMLNQCIKILEALNHVLIFFYLNNRSCKFIDKKQRNYTLISVSLYLVCRLIASGGRQRLIFIILAWLTGWLVCQTYKEKKYTRRKETRRYVKFFLIFCGILFPLFYYMGRLVGRHETDVLYAAIAYLSTGIYGLEQIISHHFSSNFWGEISFSGLYPILKIIGVLPQDLEPQSVLPYNIFLHGNTVSVFGRWYWDFGPIGVYIMTILTASFFSLIYYKNIKYSQYGHKRNVYLLIYMYLIHILYFAGYDDFVSTLIGSYYIQIIFLMILFYYFIVKNSKRTELKK